MITSATTATRQKAEHQARVRDKTMNITANCLFKKKYLYSMGEKYSKFRGKGIISLDDESIRIHGKRVYGFQSTCYLFDIVILKSEDLFLSWDQITKFEIDPKDMLIAFSVENNSFCGPIVFTSPRFEEMASIFRAKIESRERTSHGLAAVEQRYDEQLAFIARLYDKFFDRKKDL